MNNKQSNKSGKMTIDKLAIMINDSFEVLRKDIGEVQGDIKELKESNKDIRKDILNLGDRFVSYHTFDSLANRVKVLEEKSS